MVAFLFALHPAHVESVAWISERKDVLCAFFWSRRFACLCMVCAQAILEAVAHASSALLPALSCRSRWPSLFPFTLLLLDYWPLRRITFARKRAGSGSPLFGSCALKNGRCSSWRSSPAYITFIAQRAGGAVARFKTFPVERFCNAAISYCRYLRIMFWPDPLTAYYYYDFKQHQRPGGRVFAHCAYHRNRRLLALSQVKALLPLWLAVVSWER